jgi:hypothetical protein
MLKQVRLTASRGTVMFAGANANHNQMVPPLFVSPWHVALNAQAQVAIPYIYMTKPMENLSQHQGGD